jgi:histidyl-tRNA synthetase
MVMGHMGAQNTVAAGGRYDGLVEEIGGPASPGIGFALGVERAVSLIDAGSLQSPRPRLFISALGDQAVTFVLPLIHDLRSARIRVDTDYTGASLKSQMKKADKSGAAFTLIIGEQELQNGQAVLRNMETKEQVSLPLEQILRELTSRFSGADAVKP